MNKQDRNHLAMQVADRLAYKQDTVRNGSPHTLVITKIIDWYAPKHAAWRRAREDVLGKVKGLGSKVSEQCLDLAPGPPLTVEHLQNLNTPKQHSTNVLPSLSGTIHHRSFTLPPLRDQTQTQPEQTSQPRVQPRDTAAFALPQKRKAGEIIEITSDDSS